MKADPEVVAAIQRFMRHYQIENNKLIKDQYLKVHIRLAHILRDDLSEDAEELKFLLLEDWYMKGVLGIMIQKEVAT